MINTLEYEKSGDDLKVVSAQSLYQPSIEIRDITKFVKEDYATGDEILNRPFEEFNGMSLVERSNECQRNWLSWEPGESEDPEDDWRWNGVRPITRNRIISTAAHLTQNLLAPTAFAQNDQDEEDKEWGEVMEILLKYNIRRSYYDQAFLYGVISGLVNPVSYFSVDYAQSYQEAWNEDFTEKEETIDDEHSGFQYGLAPYEEILFDNPYQFFLQKQRFVIRRRRISYDEAQAKHGDRETFRYVTPGLMTVLGDDGVFYDVEDLAGNLVEEVVYKCRRTDTEIPFVSGIYVGNTNTELNPFVHRTNKNKPKYNLVKFGTEPIDAMRFFGYKSLADKMMGDQELVDRQWQLAMDGSFLATMQPTIITGAGKVDKSVMIPAAVTSLDKDAKVYPLNSNFRPDAAFSALHEAERSINESSQSPQMSGDSGAMQETARGRSILQQNAETNMGIMGKMIGFMVKEVGGLMVDDIIRYQTVADSFEMIGDIQKGKYKTFLLENNVKDGQAKTAIVRFTDRFAGVEMSQEEIDEKNLELREEAGDDKTIYEANPTLFPRLNFLITIDVEQMMKRNTAFEKAFKLEVYDRALLDPNIQSDRDASIAITRDFLLDPLVGGDTQKYLPKTQMPETLMPQMPGQEQTGKGQDLSSRVAKSVAMESAQGGIMR